MHEDMSPGWDEPLGLALAPGTQVAGFTLEAQLATGGAGTVYLATRGGQRFALKVIPRDAWGEREVDALRRVCHAHVVGLLGYALWPEKRPRYLVLTLELVEGLSLDAWALEHSPTARQLVEKVLLPLTRALAQVHASGVVHRDVKESNVVIREADGLPVLVDFGAARCEGAPRLTERLPPGTREYRSPDMLRFALEWDGGHYPASAADDLWALGVTLYWLLTRQLPFGDRDGPLVERILGEEPQPVGGLNPRVPGVLGELCLRMLRKPPPTRYPSAEALAQALEGLLEQTDDTWDVPLFPPEPRALAAPAPPAPVRSLGAECGSPPRQAGALARATRVGAVGLAVMLGVLAWKLAWHSSASDTPIEPPRTASSREALPREATPRQELAPPQPTREVGPDAGPAKSSSPAPVAHATQPEEAPVSRSHKSRSSLPAALVAGTLCVAPGCATTPQPAVEPPPSPIPCPAGTAQTYRLHRTWSSVLILFEPAATGGGIARNGEVLQVELLKAWGDFPQGTPLVGRAWFGRDRVYGRLTQVLLPGGQGLPICLDLDFNGPGVPMETGSTRTVAIINPSAAAYVVPESNKP